MKLRHVLYIIPIILNSISIATAQSNTINFEDEYMKCYDDNFTDNGKALRGFIQQSEKVLSDANIFKGISGKSYQYFLNNSGRYTRIKYAKLGFVSFMLGQLGEGNFDIKKFKACTENLKKNEAYKSSKMYRVEEILKQIETAGNVQDITTQIAKELTLVDLESTCYRLQILNFLELHGSKNLKKPNENIMLSETELKDALKIHIKAQDEIIIQDKMVSFGELLQEVKTYVKKNMSNTIIALKVEENISKQFITAIKNQIGTVINTFRDELAMKKYQRSFNELSKNEQEEIQKTYPEKIVQTNF
ncbi:hypothetical protein [Kordia sp.]|uniref:hypothetical protein n=1 Tax=Kordia sp. TaxID=1965332 RepID=UPI003D27BD8F